MPDYNYDLLLLFVDCHYSDFKSSSPQPPTAGHEDLRQDERVMQLFGLVNNMLAKDRFTAERDLSIARYAVTPLSPNSGLIGWVPNCDTLHALIREYREARKIPLNWEHRLMLGMAPDYDHLTVIHKVEVFEYALDSTSGEDLHKVGARLMECEVPCCRTGCEFGDVVCLPLSFYPYSSLKKPSDEVEELNAQKYTAANRSRYVEGLLCRRSTVNYS